MSHVPAALDQPPRGRKRQCINVFIALFLLTQILLPLDYYRRWNLGGDESDERFSWRFFSSVSLRRHKLHVSEQLNAGHPRAQELVPLKDVARTHAVRSFLSGRQTDVVEAFLQWRIAHPAVRSIEFECRSTTPAEKVLPALRLIADGETGEVRALEAAQ